MKLTELAKKLRPIMEKAVQSLSHEDALEAVTLFPTWDFGVNYAKGQKVRYHGILYVVLQEHTSQKDWTPMSSPSLFARLMIQDENIIPDWQQPSSTNSYQKGDRVRFEGKVYESLVDGNVWSPADYPAGWQEDVE